jgi:hypothetical protein
MADHITKLTDIYNRWLEKDENKNVDKGSADDVLYDDLFTNSLTKEQRKYITRFCDLWDEAVEHEYLLEYYKENKKREEDLAKADALHDIKQEERGF